MKILVVDIETTGFYPNDAIVEIGISLVDTKAKTVKLVFDKVIKDKNFVKWKHKNAWIFKNTTLKVEDVDKAKPLEYYFSDIQKLFDKYPMTAFNKSFDLRFLKNVGFKMNDIKCLMSTAKQYCKLKDKRGGVKTPSVEEIYNQFFMNKGEVYIEEHRAGADALDEGRILLHMVELKEKKQLITK